MLLGLFKSKITKYPIIIFIIGLFFISCSKNKIPEEEIVAKVGDRIITKDEFKASFEFSVSLLRRGVNPRKTYLDYMIKELLIANEGFDKGFDKSKYVTSRVKNRSENDLLEAFYLKNVHSKVNIPEEEIKDALKKATVKFRLLIWQTPTLEKAASAYDSASETDLEDYIEKQIKKIEIKNINKKNFETDWLDYLDIPPNIFSEIKNLEIGKPSKPIPYQEGYAIFQIIDLKREALKSDELIAGPRRKKIKARLYNIRSDKIIHKIMDSVLTPLNVKVRSKTIDLMVQPLYSWVKDGIPDRGSIVNNLKAVSDTSKDYLVKLRDLLPEKLYSSVDGITTVEDYFNYINYHRKVINLSENPIDLKNRLITEVGTMIKNKKFIKIAQEEGFLDSSNIVNDLEWWKEKWTYDVYRENLVKDITITEEEMKKYFKERWRELRVANVDTTRFYKYETDVYNAILFEKHNRLLNKKITELKRKYPVWINEEVLNSIELNDGPKSSQTTYFTVKKFSGELLVPTADLEWLYY